MVSGPGVVFPGGGIVDLDYRNGLFIQLDGTGFVLGSADPVSATGFGLTAATSVTQTPGPAHGIVFVSTDGSSSNPGTSTAPLRLPGKGIQRALENGATEIRIAAGVYDETAAPPAFAAGTKVQGGCNPRLWQPEPGAWSVVLVPASGATAQDVAVATEIDGPELRAADATAPGSSSVALRAANCGPGLRLRDCRLRAGAGGSGVAGASGGVSPAACPGGPGGAGRAQLGVAGSGGTAGSTCGGSAAGPGGAGGGRPGRPLGRLRTGN